MHEADFPTRSTEQYMERYEAIRGAGWHDRRGTSLGLDGPDGEASTPWTIEEEHHLTNAANIVRRSVFRRVRDEVRDESSSLESVLCITRTIVLTGPDASPWLQSEECLGVHGAIWLKPSGCVEVRPGFSLTPDALSAPPIHTQRL